MATPTFTFKSAAYGASTFTVVDFQGTEAISSLYQFDIGLKADSTQNINLRTLLEHPATLTLHEGTGSNSYSGIVARVEQQQQAGGYNYYRVLLVPPAWKLSLSVRSAGFTNMTFPAAVETVLANAQLSVGTTPGAGVDVATGDLTFDYAVRDFICQYNETDLDFICRLMEYEGIYFYFEDQADSCKMILADGLSYPDSIHIPFTDPNSTNHYESIVQMTQHLMEAPVEVDVTGYDYMNVSTEVRGKFVTTVDKHISSGPYPKTWLYDHRSSDPDDAVHQARVRTQEAGCWACTYSGSGAVPGLRAGSTFRLGSHPVAAFNREYLVTGITHTARNADQDWGAATTYTAGQTASGPYYGNSFTAIPLVTTQTAGGGAGASPDIQFRPRRITPKPSIRGVLSATVYLQPDTSQGGSQGSNNQGKQDSQDSDTQVNPIPGYQGQGSSQSENQYVLPPPPMDKYGRYLVTLPFVDATVSDGSPISAWIRMAQPTAGIYTGTQFMLEPGAEVLLSFVNGDPDLPVITGAVYNGAIPAPLNSDATDPQI